jgi:drug/metabolite transporter (DMT)-like permease
MGLCVKLNSASFNEYELVFYRSFVSLIIIIVLMKKNNITIKTKYAWFHFLRSFIGFISLLLFFYAITKLPLSTSMTLNYTSPIFLGLLIPFLMKQKFNSSKLFLLLIGFLGIVFILKPVLYTNWFAGLIGVLSGFGAAIAYIMVAKLGQLKEPDLRTVYFFTLVSSILSFGLMLKEDISPISFDINLIYLLLLGVSATIAQLAITRAYREGKTLNNAAYSYMTVIFSVGWGVWIFQENLDWLTLMGMLLIFLAGIFINKTKLRLK